jgi:hypothetical protein
MTPAPLNAPNLLQDARVYLSGPMDFVADREEERKNGWRVRIGQALAKLGATVFDPWIKPEIRGIHGYGREDEKDSVARAGWNFDDTKEGAAQRAASADAFWPALHTDLRMVDTSDFVIAFCPTNVYSVGTPHEIILARQQRKPVLFVSPPVHFPSAEKLRRHLKDRKDSEGIKLLAAIETEAPMKSNESGSPSQWYMPLVGGEHFFDGFGFYLYDDVFGWSPTGIDAAEKERQLKKPLMPFLVQLNDRLPSKWDRHRGDYGPNDDWILWKLTKRDRGAEVSSMYRSKE